MPFEMLCGKVQAIYSLYYLLILICDKPDRQIASYGESMQAVLIHAHSRECYNAYLA